MNRRVAALLVPCLERFASVQPRCLKNSTCLANRPRWWRRPSCIRTSRRPIRAPRSSSSPSHLRRGASLSAEGTAIQAMTFNGSIPGPIMVVHEGDYVELTLINPSANSLAHNVDFHAATGALGFVRH